MRKSIDHVNKTGAAAASDQVLEAIHAVMHRVRHRQQEVLREAEAGLTPMEGRVLGFFARHPGGTLKDLVEHSGRDKGQLARLVTGLRERGLLLAQVDEADRRVTRLSVSDEAAALHQAVMRLRRQLAVQAVRGFDDGERATLLALLARVQANLEDAA